MPRIAVKLVITGVALAVIVARFIWPELRVDAITLGLIIVAMLPWASDLVKSAEFPGGWKIEFQDVAKAGAKIEGLDGELEPSVASERPSYVGAADENPKLALVGLRIEIENRIRQLAKVADINATRSLMIVFRDLREGGILQEPSASGLQDLIIAGNQAAHGARVDPAAARWAIEHGPRILGVLDQAVQEVARKRL